MSKKSLLTRHVFSYEAPDALSVHLAGDFTGWEKAPINLQRRTDGKWEATVELTPGEHRYRYLVDGEWQDDPECTNFISNPFGTRDGVLEVAPGQRRNQPVGQPNQQNASAKLAGVLSLK